LYLILWNHLLGDCHVQGTVLGSGDTGVSKTFIIYEVFIPVEMI
jgi:hypothetical protein